MTSARSWRSIGGTESELRRLMTKRARALGFIGGPPGTTFIECRTCRNSRQEKVRPRTWQRSARLWPKLFPDKYRYFSKLDLQHGDRTYSQHNKLCAAMGLDGHQDRLYSPGSGFQSRGFAEGDGVRLVRGGCSVADRTIARCAYGLAAHRSWQGAIELITKYAAAACPTKPPSTGAAPRKPQIPAPRLSAGRPQQPITSP